MADVDFSKLKYLLEEQEDFPLDYTFKFIGKNTFTFSSAVKVFEKAYPALEFKGEKLSANLAHISLTYFFKAPSADAIIQVLEAVAKIEDVVVIL
jgi:putative lipoic acid-binding regulatory protein